MKSKDSDGIDLLTDLLKPFYGDAQLSREEVIEISQNVTSFFELLAEWEAQQAQDIKNDRKI